MYTLHQYSYIRARQRGRYFKLRETHLYTPPVQLYQGKVEGRYFKLREMKKNTLIHSTGPVISGQGREGDTLN